MNEIICYNTFYQITTDGRSVWKNKRQSNGYIPKGSSQIYFKIDGKRLSRKQVFNQKFLVKLTPNELKRDLPCWCYD